MAAQHSQTVVPPTIGIGLRHPHYAAVLERAVTDPLPLDFLEVHAENFFAQGGAIADVLDQAAQRYPISLHGVGLSLGSACGLDDWHLQQLKRLVQRTQPMLISDHACFGRAVLGQTSPQSTTTSTSTNTNIAHANDLLPIRHTASALDILCANVNRVQDTLQRRITVENISTYITWQDADYSEVDFLNQLSQRTGCGVLMDLNNIFVNALNEAALSSVLPDMALALENPALATCKAWIDHIHTDAVMEIHLAGFTPREILVIDDHARPVHDAVWGLYRYAIKHMGHKPTLIEWDLDIPAFDVLLDEANTARRIAHNTKANNNAIAGAI